MRIWLHYISSFSASLSPMTDCPPTWPPKPALGPVVRAWLTAAWHCTLNRLHHVYVKCICAATAAKYGASLVEPTCYAARGIGSAERTSALSGDQWLLHRITSSQKQRSEFSRQSTWSIYNKQKNLEVGAAAGITWKNPPVWPSRWSLVNMRGHREKKKKEWRLACIEK